MAAFIATFAYLQTDAYVYFHVPTVLKFGLIPCYRPRYIKGHSINIGMLCLAIALVSVTIVYCKWENGKRASGARDHRLQEESEAMLGYRHPDFKYTI
jgi:hypothetical protein